MKVLWISQNLPYPPKTGVLQRNYNLIREASTFADVHLIAIVKQDILPTFDEQVAVRELGKLCASLTCVHLPIERSRALFLWVVFKSLFTTLPFTANWALSPALRQAIEKAAARFISAASLLELKMVLFARFGPQASNAVDAFIARADIRVEPVTADHNPYTKLFEVPEEAATRPAP